MGAMRRLGVSFLWAVTVAGLPAAGSLGTALAAPAIADPLPTSPAVAAMLDDGADGRFDGHTLLAAALLASGVSSPDLPSYGAAYQRWHRSLVEQTGHQSTVYPRARAVHEFIHRRILHSYDPRATRLDVAIDRGLYNCVSATLLFSCLARDLGLNTETIGLPGHAVSVVLDGVERLEIETTCPNWFDLPAEARRRAIGRRAGGTIESPSIQPSPLHGRILGPAELVAVMYYNQGVDHLERREFAQAVSSNLRALRLDPGSAAARGNLLASINNWALALCEAGQFHEALEKLDEGLLIDPAHAPLIANQQHVRRTWARTSALP